MGKRATYKKKHKEWEQEPLFQGWLISNPNKDGSSFCKCCQTPLRAHKGDLEKHAHTVKHKRQANKVDKSQTTIYKCGVSISNNSVKRNEIILASYVATHTSIRSVDHLTDIINKFNDKRGELPASSRQGDHEKYRLHKTKCSAIIKGVIAPTLLRDLIDDIGNSPFSIIVDESTDVSIEKLLCINVKYYSEKKNELVTQFLTFLSVIHTTAQDIFDVVSNVFDSNNLKLSNLIGIGTDGASNMCGEHHSLYTFLKEKCNLNNLILVKCIFHSLHLCASKSSEVFEDEIDFLLKETYNWFNNSIIRISKYKQIYDLINIDSNFTKLSQLSGTRWLSRYRAVEKVLTQYLELETFFSINAEKERCHTAKLLSAAYGKIQNKLLLIFIHPILKQVYCLNLYFQEQDINYYKAYEDVNTLIWSLSRQILKPAIVNHLKNNLELLSNSMKFEQNYLAINDCDLGYEFEVNIDGSNLSMEEKHFLKSKCVDFIKKLLEELIKRMPKHLTIFKQLRSLNPQIILNPIRTKFSDLPLHLAKKEQLNDIEAQYRNLLNIQWSDIFENNIPDDSVTFWKKVITMKNAVGDFMFKELSIFAFTLLSLPSSNAIVERTFSIMNIVKSKLRNKLMLTLLNSIMILKFHFYANNICCKEFEPTRDMLNRFSSEIYNINNYGFNSEEEKTAVINDIDDVITVCHDYI